MKKNKKIKKSSANEELRNIVIRGFKAVDKKYEDLAVMVARGFDAVDKRFEQVDKRFEQVDKKFDGVDRRFDILESKLSQKIDGLTNRIDDLALNRATREEVKILEHRIGRIEEKIGLKKLVYLQKKSRYFWLKKRTLFAFQLSKCCSRRAPATQRVLLECRIFLPRFISKSCGTIQKILLGKTEIGLYFPMGTFVPYCTRPWRTPDIFPWKN